MVYDCFLFNDELEVLELRLEYMYDSVDFFVIVESHQTFSSLPKPLYFQERKAKFERFEKKIIHVVCGPNVSTTDAWQNEHYQRNCIMQGLTNCRDSDVILISDADEFVNVDNLHLKDIAKPTIIRLYTHYYFLNLFSKMYNEVVLATPYQYIKDRQIGNRLSYESFVEEIIGPKDAGWHFSYLFGYQMDRYIVKLRSFSHQEFNNEYYTDPKRIGLMLKYGIDLYERGHMAFRSVDLRKMLTARLFTAVKSLGLDKKYTFLEPSIWGVTSLKELKLYFKYVKHHLRINEKSTRS